MRSLGYDVECVEENKDSLKFLRELGFVTYDKKPKKTYDIVSLIHALEHIEEPISFLRGLKSNTRKWLFIEVPDAEEFNRLDKDNDEFNSCHVKFYNPDTLTEIIERSGFNVNLMVKKYYKDRDLSRLLALCE